ncbi:MAG TPA: adenylate cyclase [Nanoarchaeota archaeon]|nr:adenylate cyclase [Candidatus Pacearchaeota archaeon]HIH18188.1 adenylate cyclase [Nanoarchaeota archaeon]HIH34575.1 adenylate cyclase [Nanoarchaeota archaeon]HIH51851.1 adenylate cyclase [Nanoarchaeota archaeon]HIH66550.1 adenylate cyclase [Nanoarchaeota archaeon]
MTKQLEIEYTYLVRSVPKNLSGFRKDEIKQGYLGPKGERIRSYNNSRFEKTLKKKVKSTDFSTSTEETESLSKGEFETLWPRCMRTISKTRYYIPLQDEKTAELDLFHGALEGIAFVEVEFKTHAEAKNFSPPEWFGRDVTQEPWTINYELAGHTPQEIKKLISKVVKRNRK